MIQGDHFFVGPPEFKRLTREEEKAYVSERDSCQSQSDNQLRVVDRFCKRAMYVPDRVMRRYDSTLLTWIVPDLEDTLLQVHYKSCLNYDCQTRYGSYFYRQFNKALARNFTEEHKSNGHLSIELIQDERFFIDDNNLPADELISRREEREIIGKGISDAMNSLSEFQRTVLSLRLEGHTYTTIAKLLGRNPSNPKAEFHHVKKKLLRVLTPLRMQLLYSS